MASASHLPPAVHRYLEELERCVKRQTGVAPEEALSDAREHLLAAAEALTRDGRSLNDENLFAYFAKNYGEPAVVAEQYASAQGKPLLSPRLAVPDSWAPGWRICCTGCGRSAPLAAIGGIRLGARSVHKYTLGWCRECRWLRFMRIIQDLDVANLTAHMGTTKTPQQSLRSLHRPVLTILLILLMTFGTIGIVFGILAVVARGQDGAANGTALNTPMQVPRQAIDDNYPHRNR